MSMTRRWSGSSSSHLAAGAAANAVANSAAVVKADDAGEPSILAIGYPVSGGDSDQLKIGGFLDRCHYCKKRIANDSEVFMYGNLRAFCSAECRDNQIRLDCWAKEQQANHKEKAVGGQGTHKSKGQSSS